MDSRAGFQTENGALDAAEIAQRLLDARLRGTKVVLPPDFQLTPQQGAMIQESYIGFAPWPVVGWKIASMVPERAAEGDDSSRLAGPIFEGSVFTSPHGAQAADEYWVEGEFALTMAARIPRANTPEELARSVVSVHPAIELVQERTTGQTEEDLGTIVADAGTNGGVVLGLCAGRLDDVGADELEVVMRSSDGVLGAGTAQACLGGVTGGLWWLYQHLETRGRSLDGALVVTGSCTGFAELPRTGCTADFGRLGTVSVTRQS